MNIQLKALLLSFGILGMFAINADAAPHFYYSYLDGNRYEFMISSERQELCPKWDPKKNENPPISASSALTKAEGFIASIPIETEKGYFWELQDLSLVQVEGGWVWRGRYNRKLRGATNDGAYRDMNCWILMDGKVVQPVIQPVVK